METKLIALDIGRVCVTLRFDETKVALGYPASAAPSAAFLKACDLYEHGRCTQQRWLKIFQRMTQHRFSDQELLDAWDLIIGEPIDGIIETLQELTHAGFTFIFFSDTNRPHIDKFYRMFPATQLVKGAIFSYDVGAHKPSTEMFKAFEERYGKPCYYIDDKSGNIEGARAFGWKAHQFTTTKKFRQAFLTEFGV